MSNDNHPPTAGDGTLPPGQDALFPADERPWPTATDDHGQSRIYDHGIYWCDRADHHPDAHTGYPHPDHYRTECRSHPGLFSTGHLDHAGPPDDIEIYPARPFRYGQRADHPVGDLMETRLILAAVPLADGQCPVRFSLPITEARNLARHLHQVADVVDGYAPPWKPQAV
jgi:hypothetical protein